MKGAARGGEGGGGGGSGEEEGDGVPARREDEAEADRRGGRERWGGGSGKEEGGGRGRGCIYRLGFGWARLVAFMGRRVQLRFVVTPCLGP
jgi:hypothetical protein